MKRIFLSLFALCLIFTLSAQKKVEDAKYLTGAVSVKNGYVVFEKAFDAPGKTKEELYRSMFDYVQTKLVDGENALPQARVTEADEEQGLIVSSIVEYLYFAKKALVTHRVRFFYQLIARASDEKISLEMRRIHYLYEEDESPNGQSQDYRAEQWITDSEALNKAGTKLLRMPGKFRRFTIDRKDEIFNGMARACGLKLKKIKLVEVEE